MKHLHPLYLTLLLTLGCAAPPRQEIAGFDYTVRVGQELKIELSSNPTTGYRWQIRNKANLQGLTFVSDNYKQANAAPNIVGRGGVQTFIFRGLREGEEKLHLVYVRSWEAGARPADEKQFTVKISK